MRKDTQQSLNFSSGQIHKVPVKDFTEEAYLNYSMYVILDRALPNISDGLKPVQRRIIYAMNELSLSSNSKYKKSARTIGDVLGKYHPHGDTACYEAMVILAQSFSYNYTLIDGQGNWGTQDDPKSFAAMRYTESRLTEFSNLLLSEINMGTVDWVTNFDGTLEEPTILPSQVPNILINGSSGIAVGMSTDIPSHNLSEVINAIISILKNPKITIEMLRKNLLAPDYPTGGELLNNESDLNQIYETGHGNIKLRGTFVLKGKEIIIESIPYQTSTTKILEQIQEQIYSKKVSFIDSILDMSDQDHPVRIVIKTKGRTFKHEDIMSHLFYTTDLERNYRVNLNMIGLNGKPQVKNLKTILSEWIDFRKKTITNKLSWRLDKIIKRIHILEGFMTAYKHLDKIIKIIRTVDDPKPKLKKLFKFSEEQYEAVINLKIRNLAKLEEKEIKDELKNLNEEDQNISMILKSPKKLTNLLIDELSDISKKFGKPRLTKVVDSSVSQAIKISSVMASDPTSIILSKNGWVKAVKGHDINFDQITYKTGDSKFKNLKTYTDKKISFLDERGFVYSMDAYNIPSSRGNGEPLSKFFTIQDGTHIIGIANILKEENILTISDNGYGFICLHEDILVKQKKGKNLIRVKNSKACSFINFNPETQKHYILITDQNYMLINELSSVPVLSKGKGVKLINIPKDSNEVVSFVGVIGEEELNEIPHEYIMNRTRRGRKIDKKLLKKIHKIIYNDN